MEVIAMFFALDHYFGSLWCKNDSLKRFLAESQNSAIFRHIKDCRNYHFRYYGWFLGYATALYKVTWNQFLASSQSSWSSLWSQKVSNSKNTHMDPPGLIKGVVKSLKTDIDRAKIGIFWCFRRNIWILPKGLEAF